MSTHYADETVTLHHGDALAVVASMPSASVDCCVTSPPYFGLRDYGNPGQYGLEATPAEYVETMRALFAEVRRVLTDDGTLWLNLGDSYAGSGKGAWGSNESRETARVRTKEAYIPTRAELPLAGTVPEGLKRKDLIGIPWRTALALQDDGWTLRNDVIWVKPNAMPNPVADRMSSHHEHVFMFSKAASYWFDIDAIREGDRKPGDVWSIPTTAFADAHFAVMSALVAERAILAGCKPGGTVLDPFSGSGTTGLAATKHGRKYVGVDLSADYLDLSLRTRFGQMGLDFGESA